MTFFIFSRRETAVRKWPKCVLVDYVDYKIFFNERGLVVGKKCKIDCD